MPKVQVNGRMATLTQLHGLGESWIDFHGPGEPQKLFQERRQLEMLDAYAGVSEGLRIFRSIRNGRSGLREIEDLESSDQLDEDELDFVRKQIAKIDAVDVTEESIEELERDYGRISSAQELGQMATECAEALSHENGLNDQLMSIVGRLEMMAELDASSNDLAERGRSLQIDLEDLGDEIGRMAGENWISTQSRSSRSRRG